MTSDALSSLGIALEEVRREAGDAFDMSIPDDRKIPYAPQTKNALVNAQSDEEMGESHLGTEHVQLRILSNEGGMAVRILDHMGVPPEALEEQLFEVYGRAASGRPSC